MLEATIVLMRGSGLSGAGIDIVRKSGAPKGSVYGFPNGKGQIVAEALEVNSQRVLAFIDKALGSQHLPGDRVRALFNAFARRVAAGDFHASCAAGAVTLDSMLMRNLKHCVYLFRVPFLDGSRSSHDTSTLQILVVTSLFAG